MNVDFTSIAPLLDHLAQKIGVTVDNLWGVMIRQAITNGITDLILTLFLSIVLFVSIKQTPHFFKKAKEEEKGGSTSSQVNNEVFGILTITVAIVAIIFIPLLLTSSIKHLVNPEYYAFMDIIGLVKK